MFRSGGRAEPDALALVTRADLAAEAPVRTLRDLKGWVLSTLQVSASQLDALVAQGDVKLAPRRVSGYRALEVTCNGHPFGEAGVSRAAKRLLALPGGDEVLIVAHLSLDGMDASAATAWEYMISSLQVDPPGVLARRSLLYGGIALGGLILLVVAMRWLGSLRRPAASAVSWPPPAAMEGWGHRARGPLREPPPATPCATRPERLPQPVPATVAAGPLPGSGLTPTLPPSGRWSS